jgi:hypothetical protein
VGLSQLSPSKDFERSILPRESSSPPAHVERCDQRQNPKL